LAIQPTARDSTVVYPGHGDDTTLCAERHHLAEWKQRGWQHCRCRFADGT
jgi:glyoxylase-like metal-dependent hydrolase (beta-lactamase superfamily II)